MCNMSHEILPLAYTYECPYRLVAKAASCFEGVAPAIALTTTAVTVWLMVEAATSQQQHGNISK